MKQKKIPMRMCIACRESKPKKELIRIVKNKEGELNVDTTGKMPGRGAYLCPSVECLERAFKTKALQRALEVNMTEEMLSEIKRIILRRELGV
ncbi:MAG: YlxR family protein [Clostridiales bacterium]|nr:YlxR family protein [Clostridiales bacterium]